MGAQHIGFAPMPAVALILSRFDRAQLGSFIEIAIELMDVAQGDTDLEPEVTEQDDEPEIDDEPELDDHGGGNVEDEGEPMNDILHPAYGIDQSTGPLSAHPL